MRQRMRVTVAAVVTVGCLVLLAPSAWAIDCKLEVEQGETHLAELEQQVHQAREANRPRIRAFLADGRKVLAEARADCEAAKSNVDRAGAVAKVAMAQGSLGAARIFIKLD